jgi:cytochrome c-type biogenesis protein
MRRSSRALAGFLIVLIGMTLLFPPALAVDKAPNVSLVDVDGVPFNLTDYRGEVLMLDFMFISCEPCAILAKDLKKIVEKFPDDFNILSIDISPLENAQQLKRYAQEQGYPWRLAMDTEDLAAREAYVPFEFPTIVIIDREGFVTYKKSGHIDVDELEDEVDAALKGEAEAIELTQLGLVSFAFLAGIASFFSPCSFPLLPGYITYYFKRKLDNHKKREEAMAKAEVVGPAPEDEGTGKQVITGLKLGSISGLGIVLVYFVLGVIVIGLLYVGVTLSGDAISYLKPIVGTILIVLGILTALDVTINTGYITLPFRRLREMIWPRKGPQKPSFTASGLFLYGVGYGSASASCSAPIFLALAVAAISTGQPQDAVVTFVVYLASLWILMALVTVLLTVSEERVKSGLMKHYILIKKVTGVVFLIAGGYLIYLFLAAEGYIG